MVTVRQLFFNTPARRKFLKTIGTEMGHIADMVARIALGTPAVQLRLTHNEKIVKDWPAAAVPFDRVVDVLGNDLKNSLHAIAFSTNGISIGGWIASPRVTRRTSRAVFIFVNGRFVRDRIVQHALFEGYSQRLVKGQFPVAVIHINLPFDAVDVNVHPTKNEVRFARQREVHEAVRRAVAQTLYEVDLPQWRPAGSAPDRVSETKPYDLGFGISDFGYKESKSRIPATRQTSNGGHPADTRQPDFNPKSEIRNLQSKDSSPALWKQKLFGDMRIIGQFQNTYIVCESEQGLILIDQHAAHERVLYEQFSARASGAQNPSQRLLVPETIELGYREAGVLEKMIPQFKEMGLDIEPFGGSTFVVKAVPVLLAGREIKPILIEMVEKIAEVGTAPGLDAIPHGDGLPRCDPCQPGPFRNPDQGSARPARRLP
jgi:DNA mismatch repair protein MutL